jgi:hypothetical protein
MLCRFQRYHVWSTAQAARVLAVSVRCTQNQGGSLENAPVRPAFTRTANFVESWGCQTEEIPTRTALPELEPLKFAFASGLSVRLKSFDGEFPVVVSIERKAIDDLFKLPSSTEKQRIKIVMSNLAEISGVVRQRHARRDWIEVTMNRARVRHIVLRDEDYRGANLVLPVQRNRE